MTHPRPTKNGPEPQRNALPQQKPSLIDRVLGVPQALSRMLRRKKGKKVTTRTRTKAERAENRRASRAQTIWHPVAYMPSPSERLRNKRITRMISRTKRGVRNG